MRTRHKLFVLLALGVFAATASADSAVYVVTFSQQFGALDLTTGAFHAIGAGTPDPVANLVPAPNGQLFSLDVANGNLVSINPGTGATTVVGPTGVGAFGLDLAEVNGKLYMTDLSNNLYSVNATTGAETLIGATGMPPDPTYPFTMNPDGTINLCDESLYDVGNKLYASFDSFKLDPVTLNITDVVPPDLWQIDPTTGVATLIGPTIMNLGASVDVGGTFYAFRVLPTPGAPINELYTLDLANGNASFVGNIDPVVTGIFGAAPVSTVPEPASIALTGTVMLIAVWGSRRRRV
jgi:hypothetical protein